MNAKYHFAFWRPYTAIHDADTDGNPNTVADPNWVPLIVTPGHPEYPSNHGCVTEAIMEAFTAFFETDEIPPETNESPPARQVAAHATACRRCARNARHAGARRYIVHDRATEQRHDSSRLVPSS